MKTLNKTLAKGALGTVAAGAMALATATPAVAKDRDGIGAGEVIAGALIIGGIAAAAGAFDGDRDRYRDNRYRDRNWNNRGHWNNRGNWDRRGFRGGPRQAVERCVRVAERQARRFGGYRFADVTDVYDVDRTRWGFRVKGRMQVQGLQGRGYGYGNRGFDRGRFTCFFDGRGRPQIDFRGIRGL